MFDVRYCLKMGIIKVAGISIHAFHDCLPEEEKNGQEYFVDVIAEGDLSKAVASDELKDAVDYCEVYDIVAEEMMIRSKLIEHVGGRILTALKKKYPDYKFSVTVIKPNPPVNGEVESASITLEG